MRLVLVALLIIAPTFAWANLPYPDQPRGRVATAVVVRKAERRLELLSGKEVIARYPVSLGGAPVGAKREEGDERTPGRRYTLDWHNSRSVAYRSVHVSYPDPGDLRRAPADGRDPGGMIMIHGMPRIVSWVGRLHRIWDWTDGCIAVANPEMDQMWAAVPDGTPITTLP